MALTLPYPDMDFVPLDILTAQEQDQLVANIEYISSQFPVSSANIANNAVSTAKIADSAVTNAKIANSAVKSQNIDWATLTSEAEVSSGYLKYRRFNNIVTLTVNVLNSVKSDGAVLGTMPTGYRPLFALAERNVFDNQTGRVQVSTDGKVIYASNTGNSDYILANFTYLCK